MISTTSRFNIKTDIADHPTTISHNKSITGMSKLQKINDVLKVVAFPESIRQRIVKFYLLNIELGKRTYDREISSEQVRNM